MGGSSRCSGQCFRISPPPHERVELYSNQCDALAGEQSLLFVPSPDPPENWVRVPAEMASKAGELGFIQNVYRWISVKSTIKCLAITKETLFSTPWFTSSRDSKRF